MENYCSLTFEFLMLGTQFTEIEGWCTEEIRIYSSFIHFGYRIIVARWHQILFVFLLLTSDGRELDPKKV